MNCNYLALDSGHHLWLLYCYTMMTASWILASGTEAVL